MSHAVCTDVCVFDIKQLPPEILLMILENLNLEDLKKMRHLDSWFEKKVSSLLPDIFGSYNIKTTIRKKNCDEILSFLTCAMSKYHRKKKELHLMFTDEHTPEMAEFLVTYKKNVVSLEIIILYPNIDLGYLIEPGLKFDFLEKLTLLDNENEMWTTFYSIIAKNADKLKILEIDNFLEGSSLPALPCLEYLELKTWEEIKNWEFLLACNQITKLNIEYFCLNEDDDIDDENDEDFEDLLDLNAQGTFYLPNLEHLIISDLDQGNLATQNANTLVFLETVLIDKLPEFPKLRELVIYSYDFDALEDLLSNCTNTLEFLALAECRTMDVDEEVADFPLSLPKLTDLYLQNISSPNNLLQCNHNSLEFLFLDNVDPLPNFTSGLKMEKVETVILKPHYQKFYTETDLKNIAELCPNAEMIVLSKENKDEILNLVKSRCKKKNIKIDIKCFLEI